MTFHLWCCFTLSLKLSLVWVGLWGCFEMVSSFLLPLSLFDQVMSPHFSAQSYSMVTSLEPGLLLGGVFQQ